MTREDISLIQSELKSLLLFSFSVCAVYLVRLVSQLARLIIDSHIYFDYLLEVILIFKLLLVIGLSVSLYQRVVASKAFVIMKQKKGDSLMVYEETNNDQDEDLTKIELLSHYEPIQTSMTSFYIKPSEGYQ